MDKRQARPVVAIVTPAWAQANNGNWQTARRWARLLGPKHTVLLADGWPQGRVQAPADGRRAQLGRADALIALHARRCADSIEAWHAAVGPQSAAVVLTGTDLYGDLPGQDEAAAQAVMQSLRLAGKIVVLQDQALLQLPPAHRSRARVILQSTTAWRPLPKTDPATRGLRAVVVGHLRQEKDPATLQAAALLLRGSSIRIDHLGAALEPSLAAAARATADACPDYRWLGALPHAQARKAIQRAHVLVHCSRIEGGAHVIMEAVRSGTPVLASRVSGNVGMLGADYAGYFPAADATALADALRRFQQDVDFRVTLQRQCSARAELFSPEREGAELDAMVAALLSAGHRNRTGP